MDFKIGETVRINGSVTYIYGTVISTMKDMYKVRIDLFPYGNSTDFHSYYASELTKLTKLEKALQ